MKKRRKLNQDRWHNDKSDILDKNTTSKEGTKTTSYWDSLSQRHLSFRFVSIRSVLFFKSFMRDRWISFFKDAPSISMLIIVVAVFLYYFWLAGTNGAPFVTRETTDYFSKEHSDEIVIELGNKHYGFYNLLADAFERHQLNLPVEPVREMLSLASPYNPQQHAPYRLHDASLYKGKYYLYFGPVPVLSVFLPIRWITGIKATEPLVVALFCFCVFVVSILILTKLVRRWNIKVPKLVFLTSMIALGFGTPIPYFLRRPTVYEVAISGGTFYALLGLWFLLGAWKNKPSLTTTATASLCFGLATGCRPVYFVSGLLLAYLWLVHLTKQRAFSIKYALISAIAFGFPFGFLLMCLGFYNYLRFDSWIEFGTSHVLGSVPLNSSSLYRFENILPGAFISLFSLPKLIPFFPFLQLQMAYPWGFPLDYCVLEPIAGILITSSPVLFVGLLARHDVRRHIGHTLSPIFFLGLLVFAFEVFLFPSVTMRYQIDYVYLFLITGLVSWMYFASSIKGLAAFLAKMSGFFIILFSIIIQTLIGFTGCQDLFRRSNPSNYFAIADFFSPISNMFINSGKLAIMDLTVPAGGFRFTDGSEGFWIGREGLHLRIYSPQKTTIVISYDFVPLPEISSSVELTTRLPDGSHHIFHRQNPSFERLSFVLNPGINRIVVSAVPEAGAVGQDVILKAAFLKNLKISPTDAQ